MKSSLKNQVVFWKCLKDQSFLLNISLTSRKVQGTHIRLCQVEEHGNKQSVQTFSHFIAQLSYLFAVVRFYQFRHVSCLQLFKIKDTIDCVYFLWLQYFHHTLPFLLHQKVKEYVNKTIKPIHEQAQKDTKVQISYIHYDANDEANILVSDIVT